MTTLEIYADPTCPWCLIAKAELDRALESRADHPLEINWQPFRLNPDMPKSGMDHVAYMTAKFGDQAGIIAATQPFLKAAERLGLWVNMAAIDRVPPMLDAFRLLHWARIEGAQGQVMSGLMKAYWREGANLADAETLAAIGARAGMDAPVITRLLASDADREEVLTREAAARERGVRELPTFILANTHVVTGAQPATLWQQVIDELLGAIPS